MRVLIDATGVTRQKAGVGIYGKNLIDSLVHSLATPHAGGLSNSESATELFLVVQDDDPDLHYDGIPGVRVLRMPSRLLRSAPLRLIFEQTVLPLLLLRYRIDVVHSLHYSFPLLRFGARAAVTLHDMTALSMPEVHIGMKRRYYRFYIHRAGRRADALIFVSSSARQDYLARFGAPRGLSTVIHHGKDPVFQPVHDAKAVDAARARYKLPERYILYLGTIEPRKNLERLVEAFAAIASEFPDYTLVIAGMMGWKQEHLAQLVSELGLKTRILFPGFIEEADKPALIAGCSLFAYVSLYEGFGLPVLEALASGVPVVSSNTSSLPEVAGDAAVLVDPKDTAAIAAAMRAVLSDPALARQLRESGPRQAASFTWQQTAAATSAVYRALHPERASKLR